MEQITVTKALIEYFAQDTDYPNGIHVQGRKPTGSELIHFKKIDPTGYFELGQLCATALGCEVQESV